MFSDLLPSRPNSTAISLRSQPCQRLMMCSNAGQWLAEVGKRHLPLFSAREHSLTSPSFPQCFLANLLGRWPLTRPASDKLQRRKEEEVGGALQATVFHTDSVAGFVGMSSTFFDLPRPFLLRLEQAVHC